MDFISHVIFFGVLIGLFLPTLRDLDLSGFAEICELTVLTMFFCYFLPLVSFVEDSYMFICWPCHHFQFGDFNNRRTPLKTGEIVTFSPVV